MKRVVATIALLTWSCAVAQAPASPEQQMLKLLNLERYDAGLPLLKWDAQLAEAAESHSRKMASHGELSHQLRGEPELTQRVSATGARFNALAENVALAGDPQEAHLALMNSPGHRANILNSEYNAVGVAFLRVRDKMYVTEDFARIVRAYSAEQFRSAIVAAFNRSRQSHRSRPIDSHPDPQLDREACSGRADPKSVLSMLHGATQAMVFTASEPDELPPPLEKAAADYQLRRMSIGVCFRTDPKDKVSKFWVVAAFYTSVSSQSQSLPRSISSSPPPRTR